MPTSWKRDDEGGEQRACVRTVLCARRFMNASGRRVSEYKQIYTHVHLSTPAHAHVYGVAESKSAVCSPQARRTVSLDSAFLSHLFESNNII